MANEGIQDAGFRLGDLNAVHGTAAAERVGRQSDASASFLAMLDRKFLQVFTETDPVQSAAIKDIQRGRAMQPTEEGGE